MNLVGTLAKVAMGVMVARGVGKMMGGRGGGGGLGGLLGGLTGGGRGAQPQSTGGGGLGGMLSGGGKKSGGLGGLLGSLSRGQQQQNDGGLGGMLNQAFGGQAIPEPKPDQNAQAEIMLRGMINAAKSDGEIDQAEQAKIVEHLGDLTQEEIDFVRNEMAQPLDVDGFVRSVPKGLEQQVYLMSLLAINLDSQAEAKYLDRLARGFGISQEMANQIHSKVGVPNLYS